jgi:hypothetical protein
MSTLMDCGYIYDSSKFSMDDICEKIRKCSGDNEVEFDDSEMTMMQYFGKFRSLVGWNDTTRYCLGRWEEAV